MDHRDSSRPDELDRRKEEARLARACQARVLPEADSVQVTIGDTAFVRVPIPTDEQDDIGRLAREIFAPYIQFLTSSGSLTSSSLRHGKVVTGAGKNVVLSSKAIVGEAEGGVGGTALLKSSSFPPTEATETSSGLHKQNSTSALPKHVDSLTSTSAAGAADGNNAHTTGTGRGADSTGGSKRPSSLPLSQHTHPVPANKPAKTPMLRTPPGPPPGPLTSSQPSTTTPQEPIQPSLSSPVNSVLSPCNQKDIPTAPSRDGTSQSSVRNGSNGRHRDLTPPPPASHHIKSRRPPLVSEVTKDHPPKSKTASSQLSSLSSSSSSSSLPSSKDRRHQQPMSSPSKVQTSGKDSQARVSLTSSSAPAGHQDTPSLGPPMPITSASSPSTPTVTTTSSSSLLSSSQHKHSTSHSPKHTPSLSMLSSSTAKEARTSSSGKANGSNVSPPPGNRPRSATPTKASRPLNGVNPSISKLLTPAPPSSSSSSLASSSSSNLIAKDAKIANATSSSAENKTKLKILMPADAKKITSKSDLDSIFREMEPLQRHSGIETPQKAGDRFPFGPMSALAAATVTASAKSADRDTSNNSSSGGAAPPAATSKQDEKKTLQSMKQEDAKGDALPKRVDISATDEKPVLSAANRKDSASTPTKGPKTAITAGGDAADAIKDDAKLKSGSKKDMQPPYQQRQSTITTTTTTTTTTIAGAATTLTTNSGTVTTVVASSGKKPRSIGKILPDAEDAECVLKRDLDLSSDESEAEQTSDDNKTSASQSKKGKVIGPSGGGAPVKIPQSASSSSNSSSESSSENEGNEDEENQENNSPQAKGKRMPKSPSSNSSNSSSESESESGSNDDEDDEDEDDDNKGSKEEAQATSPGEKTPSPPQSKPASGSIVQESGEPSMSWRLDNFIQTPKKNTNSPANHSPLKSPNSVHSGPPSVPVKEEPVAETPDSSRSRSLKDIGPSVTMPFDPGVTRESAVDSDDNLADKHDDKDDGSDNLGSDEDGSKDSSDDDDEEDIRVKKKKKRKKLVSLKEAGVKLHSSSSSYQSNKQKSSISGEKSESKSNKTHEVSSGKKKDAVQRPTELRVSSSALISSEKFKRQNSSLSTTSKSAATTPVKGSESSHKKKKSSKITSHSDDEIDVVSITPDVRGRQRLSPSPAGDTEEKRKQEAGKRLFDKHSSDISSDESDSKLSAPKGKNAHIHDTKRHRRKHSPSSSPPLTASNHPIFHTAQTTAGKIVLPMRKKFSSDSAAVTLKHLESMAKPPNLLSPVHSAFSPPSASSSKEPLPPFEQSFSPAPHPAGTSCQESSSVLASPTPSIVIFKQNHDGTNQPQITVQVPVWHLPERSLTWLREKKRKSRTASSSSFISDKTKEEPPLPEKSPHKSTSLSSSSSGQQHESKNTRVPSIPDSKLSSPSSGKRSSSSSDISHQKAVTSTPSSQELAATSAASKPEKRKLSDSNGLAHPPSSFSSSSQYKIPKTSKNTKRESQGSSNQSPASGTSEKSSSTKSNKLAAASPDRGKPAGSSGAVKNLDFSTKNSDHSVVPNGAPSFAPSKPAKRKGISRDEAPNKKSKTDSSISTSEKEAPSIAEPTLKRQDSSSSSSGRSSHKPTTELPSSSSSNKKSERDTGGGSNNNNSIEKVTNGPDSLQLPFNHYVNGSADGSSSGTTTTAATTDATTTNSNTKRDHSSPPSLSSSLPPSSGPAPHLPQPPPVENEIHSNEHYCKEAKKHKRSADEMKEKSGRYLELYLRSGLSFLLAGYTLELKQNLSNSAVMYQDTHHMLQCIRPMSNSASSGSLPERNRKLMVLIIRLRSYLLHSLFRLKRHDVNRVKREIEENKVSSSGSHKPHAPSPHQANNHWNKNSTGTPSPMSPTPSPAGSVSSQGSASEHISGKLPNGNAAGSVTSMTSPSPGHGVINFHQRYMNFFKLTHPLVKATELWDQADAEARSVEDFFTSVDKMCGPLAFHSSPQFVVRYMKYALIVLNS